MRKVHISDYATEQGVSTKTVYDWVSKGKVRHLKEKGERHTTTYILVDEEENQVKHQVLQGNTNSEQNIPLHTDNTQLLEFMREMSVYIEKAGAVKLLEDSETRTREQYFEITAENKTLIKDNATLKAKVETLQEKLKQYEEKQNKPNWWSKL